ncbi:hypothetical protein HYPBUDRAFT_8844 [Hyphopichia burtonii NRRL Y-1933]|uniref:Uncharacterized protein n=1 Tax=Hyphopichia burtonii NRRL Y-1933 TaxID=984485 RepID=A0A1E4RQB6_9ASCO|nr:hypothetical protein HYPBUDRAFT_8844 [Hyphopichia burtonii NRRL Y-1933]ODV69469.1 hypothetical protein HYPBUDRAFT_8844 [Hyphopichia burtonii NRRL Y-1933]
MSISASTPSKRIALAPINLNVNSPYKNQNTSTPHRLNRLKTNITSLLNSVSRPSTPYKSPSNKKISSIRKPNHKSFTSNSFSDYKISNNKNATADLAATKLKLKLQLALYKVQQQINKKISYNETTRPISKFNSYTKYIKPNESNHSTPTSFNMSQVSSATPPSPTHYQSSININLQTKTNSSIASCNNHRNLKLKPSLSSIAKQKNQLKLFQIKKNSSFYNENNQLPLSNPSIKTFHHQTNLPSINKILKTPIKSSRNLVNNDETIDETIDESSLAINVKKRDILTSSPLKEHNFGTPNSFSVAKSLLQLGSGYY